MPSKFTLKLTHRLTRQQLGARRDGGEEEQARALARSIICSATAFHSPEHLIVAVLSAEEHIAHWDWIKWLPHALSREATDAVGPMRMVTTSLTDLAALLPKLAALPKLKHLYLDGNPFCTEVTPTHTHSPGATPP